MFQRVRPFAASLQVPVLGVHGSPSEEEAGAFTAYWSVWGIRLPLEVVVSP
jgi:hypothetical protein